MNPAIEALKKLDAQKITKGKLPALQEAYDDVYAFLDHLYSKSDDENTNSEFDAAYGKVESALSNLDSAISDLNSAEEKDDRDDAISMIEDALPQVISGFDEIMPLASVSTAPRSALPPPSAEELDREFVQKVQKLANLPWEDRLRALFAWAEAPRTPALAEMRKERLKQFLDSILKKT